jgi:hypothetical protein
MLDTKRVDTSVPNLLKVQAVPVETSVWIPAITAAIYPWILDGFHWVVTPVSNGSSNTQISTASTLLAALLLLAAFAVPLVNLMIASRPQLPTLTAAHIWARRFALLAVTAPTVYVLFGVLTYMAGSKIPDTWIWTPAWLLFGYWVSRASASASASVTSRRYLRSGHLRVTHGVTGAIVAVYVVFHIFNHLFGLISPEAHGAVMDIGRKVYRAAAIEPLLVAAMLFQIATGLRLAWTWSETSIDRYRVFQVASGVFMSVFILGHMNSVFVFARSFLKIPTDWAFATGLPTGLIHDPWNIRLVPHYSLGVFLVLAHLCSGLRVVMLAHNVNRSAANRTWWVGTVLSALVSAAIMCGMTGLRLV